MIPKDAIIALATPSGTGAIGVIRLSGAGVIKMADPFLNLRNGRKLNKQKGHTIHLGNLMDGDRILDEVLVSLFKGPHSYTGEDVVELSCHGSTYVQQQIIQLFLRNGFRIAEPGEFTLRAFLNGKIDLSQAEAVADLIASDTEAGHRIAIRQMRGGFSSEIKMLREELLNFASLIELELDFAEEDVEFADRSQFKALISQIDDVLRRLINSFAVGNVIKNGIPVAIVGEPNVGKSTLLNTLLNEEKAIVSDIAGTTRDAIEDEISIGGYGFRFIDTAGIRDTADVVEGLGIKKTFEKIESAQVVIYLFDAQKFKTSPPAKQVQVQPDRMGHLGERPIQEFKDEIEAIKNKYPLKNLIIVANKIDKLSEEEVEDLKSSIENLLMLSAKTATGVDELKSRLLEFVNMGELLRNETIVTNVRHYDSLLKALEALERVQMGMSENLPSDLLALDIKEALNHLGEITGQVTSEELLGNIFSNFCIGK